MDKAIEIGAPLLEKFIGLLTMVVPLIMLGYASQYLYKVAL